MSLKYYFYSGPKNQSSLFDELLPEDADALGTMDEGADITGIFQQYIDLYSYFLIYWGKEYFQPC